MMLSGTPALSPSAPYFLKVTDSSPSPQSIIWSYNLGIYNQLVVNCQTSNGPSLIGQFYLDQCGGSGGVVPTYLWISDGALPAGISLNSNGSIQGTPTTPGPYSYTLSVTDSLTPTAAIATQTFAGVIAPLPPPLDTTKVSGSMAHLAVGDGWSTTTVLMNLGTSYAQAHVGYFGDDGSPLSLPLTESPSGLVATSSEADQIMSVHSMFVIDSAPPAPLFRKVQPTYPPTAM
jgi:hypothetical protein